jgi:hypothetical protein
MHLSKAIKEFPSRRLGRLKLPIATALQDACKAFQVAGSHTEEDKERLKRILTSLQTQTVRSLGNRDIRFITSAIGSNSSIGDDEVTTILAEIERRQDDRLVRSVFKALLASYRDAAMRNKLRSFLGNRIGALTFSFQRFARESRILEGDGSLVQFGRELSQSGDIFRFCVSKGITGNILSTSYGTELKLASIRAALVDPKPKLVEQLFNWVFADISGTPLSDYYETILSPFQKTVPPADVHKILMGTLVKKFKDPRIEDWPRLVGKNGEDRRAACLSTIKRWLSIEYLDLFIRIIEATAVELGSIIYLIQCKHTSEIEMPIDAGLLVDAQRVRENWRAPEAIVVGISNAKKFAPRIVEGFKKIGGRLIARDKLAEFRLSYE